MNTRRRQRIRAIRAAYLSEARAARARGVGNAGLAWLHLRYREALARVYYLNFQKNMFIDFMAERTTTARTGG